MLRSIWKVSLAFTLACLMTATSRAEDPKPSNVEFQLGEMADNVAGFLKEELKKTKIRMEQFRSIGKTAYSGGTGFSKLLCDQLTKRGISIATFSAPIIIRGSYEAVNDSSSGHLAMLITVNCVDAESDRTLNKQQFRIGIFGNENLAQYFGVNVSLNPKDSVKEQNAKIREKMEKPDAYVGGEKKTLITPDNKSPYAMEILIKGAKGYQPRAVEIEEGFPLVAIQKDEVYGVRLINNSPYEAAVGLSIDGLSMFTFSTVKHEEGIFKGRPKYKYVLVKPKSSLIVKGWHITNKKSDEFLVTTYAKSAANLYGLKNKTFLGTITATFGAAWEQDSQPPPDEPRQGTARSAGGTGFGKRIGAEYKEAKRALGVLRGSISVRYLKPR